MWCKTRKSTYWIRIQWNETVSNEADAKKKHSEGIVTSSEKVKESFPWPNKEMKFKLLCYHIYWLKDLPPSF